MSEIHHELDGSVGIIRLNAPERRNALSVEMSHAFCAALDELEATDSMSALVVTGSGGSFCAGATRELLAAVGEDPAAAESVASISAVYQIFVRLSESVVPTFAAVTGAAVGAGVNLALATDVRMVGPSSRFISGFNRIGLHPGGGHFALIGRIAGPSTAIAMTLAGQEVRGADAVSRGLAWQCVDDDDLETATLALAASVSADADLVRRTCATYREVRSRPELAAAEAIELERGPQLWSLARRHQASLAPPVITAST